MQQLGRTVAAIGLVMIGIVVLQDLLSDASWLLRLVPPQGHLALLGGANRLPRADVFERWVCTSVGVGALLSGVLVFVRPVMGRLIGLMVSGVGATVAARQLVTVWQLASSPVELPAALADAHRWQFVWASAGGMTLLLAGFVLVCLLLMSEKTFP